MTVLPSPTRNSIESAIIRRFSSRSTLTTFSRCSPQVFPTSVHIGAKLSASTRSAGSGADVATARHPERGDPRVRKALPGQQLEQLDLLRIGARKARLDQIDPQLVEPVGDAQLLLRRQRHTLPLHPVAQGRVIQFDPSHAALDGTLTTSSHST